MKVKELIEALKEFDPEALVVLSSDSEGNSFSELHSKKCIGYGYWDSSERECHFEEEEEEYELLEDMDLPECVVLFP